MKLFNMIHYCYNNPVNKNTQNESNYLDINKKYNGKNAARNRQNRFLYYKENLSSLSGFIDYADKSLSYNNIIYVLFLLSFCSTILWISYTFIFIITMYSISISIKDFIKLVTLQDIKQTNMFP